jgi:hypothetical protein
MNPVHLHWVQEVRGTNVRRATVYSMDSDYAEGRWDGGEQKGGKFLVFI